MPRRLLLGLSVGLLVLPGSAHLSQATPAGMFGGLARMFTAAHPGRALQVSPVVQIAALASAPVPAPEPNDAAPPPLLPIGRRVADWAVTQVGVPYVRAGTGPWGYDCSGLALAAWRTAGVELPRVAADQYGAGIHVPLADAQPGDLVFFGGWGIYHVGISVGGGQMVEAPYSGLSVRVVPVDIDGPPLPLVTRPAG